MTGTWRVFRAELLRLRATRVTHLAALFLLLVPALHVAVVRLLEAAERIELARRGREPLGLDEGLGWAPFAEAWRIGLALAALLLLIHGARAVAGDRDRGYLRLASTRTASRAALVLGRALLGPLLVVGATIVTGLGAWGAASLTYDFGALVEDAYTILTPEELRAELVPAVLSAMLALLAVHAAGLLVSALARGATLAVAAAVALFLAFDLLEPALGESAHWVFASYSPSLVDGSAMEEFVAVAGGYSDAGYPQERLRMGLLLPLPQALLLTALASLVLGRRRL